LADSISTPHPHADCPQCNPDAEKASVAGGFGLTKDVSGAWRWVGIYSNRFKDREKEAFAELSNRRYVQAAEKSGRFPELRLWHVPMPIGQGDFVDYTDEGFCIASGTITKGFEDVAERLAADKNLGMSHGFSFDPAEYRFENGVGVYHQHFTKEVSVLPLKHAANELTAFAATKQEADMGLTKERRDWLVAKIGEDRVGVVEGVITKMLAGLEDEGISFKDLFEEPEVVPAPAPEVAPVVPEPEPAVAEKALTADGLKDLLLPMLAPIGEKMTAMAALLEQHTATIADLKRSDDQKTADSWFPRRGPVGSAASGGKDNILDADDAVVAQAKKDIEAQKSGKNPWAGTPIEQYFPMLAQVNRG
jgi:hypothetical protein